MLRHMGQLGEQGPCRDIHLWAPRGTRLSTWLYLAIAIACRCACQGNSAPSSSARIHLALATRMLLQLLARAMSQVGAVVPLTSRGWLLVNSGVDAERRIACMSDVRNGQKPLGSGNELLPQAPEHAKPCASRFERAAVSASAEAYPTPDKL